MVATIVWLGGLFLMGLVVWPGAHLTLGGGPELRRLIRALQRRLNPLAWFSLAVLTATGLVQLTANKNYNGLLNITNTWTLAILLKHLFVMAMFAVGAYQQMALTPALERGAARQAAGRDFPEAARLYRRELALIRLNLALGLLVLLLTAVARALG